ncbi:hypothetical protein D3C71_1084670 [compost metagenome]
MVFSGSVAAAFRAASSRFTSNVDSSRETWSGSSLDSRAVRTASKSARMGCGTAGTSAIISSHARSSLSEAMIDLNRSVACVKSSGLSINSESTTPNSRPQSGKCRSSPRRNTSSRAQRTLQCATSRTFRSIASKAACSSRAAPGKRIPTSAEIRSRFPVVACTCNCSFVPQLWC